jgi:hypothetical protein
LLDEACADGANFVVFPECFVSLYPSGSWAAPASTWVEGGDELWERMWASSVDVNGPLVERLAKACAERGGVHLAIGVNEREDARPGTLYNSLLAHRTRRVCCTGTASFCRRCTSACSTAMGAGDDLDVVDIPGVGARRRPALLGEPHAARALARLPRRSADLAGADGRRQRWLDRVGASPSRSRPARSS